MQCMALGWVRLVCFRYFSEALVGGESGRVYIMVAVREEKGIHGIWYRVGRGMGYVL